MKHFAQLQSSRVTKNLIECRSASSFPSARSSCFPMNANAHNSGPFRCRAAVTTNEHQSGVSLEESCKFSRSFISFLDAERAAGQNSQTLSIAEFPVARAHIAATGERGAAFWPPAQAERAMIAQWSSRQPNRPPFPCQDIRLHFSKNLYNRTRGKKGDCAMFWSHRPRRFSILKGGRALTQSAARARLFSIARVGNKLHFAAERERGALLFISSQVRKANLVARCESPGAHQH